MSPRVPIRYLTRVEITVSTLAILSNIPQRENEANHKSRFLNCDQSHDQPGRLGTGATVPQSRNATSINFSFLYSRESEPYTS